MALMTKFDLSSDFTQFFFFGLIAILGMIVLLTWVAPKARDNKKRKEKVDDRYAAFQGDLID